MFKILLQTPSGFRRMLNIPFLRHFVVFDVSALSQIRDEGTFSLAIEQLKLGNGTYKTTSAGRFKDLDKKLLGLLNISNFLSIHDLAVSDGTTSSELFRLLKDHGANFKMDISDLYSKINIYRKGILRFYFDGDRSFVFGSCLGIYADANLPVKFLLSRVLGSWMSKFSSKGTFVSEAILLNPIVRRLIEINEISFRELDIFNMETPSELYDVVRCMNIFNRKYFSDDMLIKGLRNTCLMLKPDGFFVVGRTEVASGINRASIYVKSGHTMKKVVDLNGGSEISELIDKLTLSETK